MTCVAEPPQLNSQLDRYCDALKLTIELEREFAVSMGVVAEDWDGIAWPGFSGPQGEISAPGVKASAGWENLAVAHAELRSLNRCWGRWREALVALPLEHSIMGEHWQLAVSETLGAGLTLEEFAEAAGAHRHTVSRHRRCGLEAMVRWLMARW